MIIAARVRFEGQISISRVLTRTAFSLFSLCLKSDPSSHVPGIGCRTTRIKRVSPADVSLVLRRVDSQALIDNEKFRIQDPCLSLAIHGYSSPRQETISLLRSHSVRSVRLTHLSHFKSSVMAPSTSASVSTSNPIL
jgi:hypothetical protein